MMNQPNNCACYTNGTGIEENYSIGNDHEGNSLLTGDGKGYKHKTFTLDAIETWGITYYS